MEYHLKIKKDKKGKALINHLKTLDFVELEEYEGFDETLFKTIIKKNEKSHSLSIDEIKDRLSVWAKKKN